MMAQYTGVSSAYFLCFAGECHLLVVQPVDCEWSILDRHGGSEWNIRVWTDGDGNVKPQSGVACSTTTPYLVLPQSADVVHAVSEQYITHITSANTDTHTHTMKSDHFLKGNL